jgi:hypothetical protein
MKQLNFPEIGAKFKKDQGNILIFDIIRKKYLKLTPEEWVRQHAVHFLIHQRHYPKGLIALESGLKFNNLQKRSDILVYDRKGQPFMLIECKAPEVKITQKVFEQAFVYNNILKAPYLVVTNGLQHFCCHIDSQSGKSVFLKEMPAYEAVKDNL